MSHCLAARSARARRRPRLLVAARALAAALLALAAGAGGGVAAGAGAARAAACDGPLAVLLDGSGSMADVDPGAGLRLAVAGALDRAQRAADGGVGSGAAGPGGASLTVFADHVTGTAVAPRGAIEASARGLLAGKDAGSTDLVEALGAAGGDVIPSTVVLVTDGDPVLEVPWPGRLSGARLVVVGLGGPAPSWLGRAARRSGGASVVVRLARDAARVAAVAGCGAAVVATEAAPAARRAVVIVSGLRTTERELRGVTTVAGCLPADGVRRWCEALVREGAAVWVPSIAPRGRGPSGRTVLDSTGPLRPNAVALARWVGGRVLTRPIYLGHSMGGLVAHAAVSWSGAPSGGLVTVGTPHDGSFGADAYSAALSAAVACTLACPALTLGLVAGATTVRHRFGAALADLSRRRRTHDDPLPALPTGVPVALYAGAVNRSLPVLVGGGGRALEVAGGAPRDYLFPNDGIVGVGSALGARLGGALLFSMPRGTARHSANVPPRSAPTELASAETADFVVRAYRQLTASGTAERLAVPGPAAPAARARRPLPVLRRGKVRAAPALVRVSAPLTPVVPLAGTGAGEMLPAGVEVILSVRPIGVVCDGVPVAALAITPALYVLDLAAIGCARAWVSPDLGAPAFARPGDGAVGLGATAAMAGAQLPDGPAPGNPLRPGDASESAPLAVLRRRAGGRQEIRVSGLERAPLVRAGRTVVAMRAVTLHGAVARELPPRPGLLRRFQGVISARVAARGAPVTVRAAGPGGVTYAAALELR